MELKKNPKHNLDQKRPLFFFIGLLVAILAIISAFEWKSEYEPIDLSYTNIIEEPIIYVQQTVQKKPEPPKPKVKKQVSAKAPSTKIAEIDNTMLEKFHEELFKPDDFIETIEAPLKPAEVAPVHNDLVESPASYPGGWNAFNQYIAENIRFPRQAVNVGLDGKVFVQFSINKDGSISDIQILRGLGMGCDTEAIRVLQTIPKKFTPAKNRGVNVQVKMILPIYFRTM